MGHNVSLTQAGDRFVAVGVQYVVLILDEDAWAFCEVEWLAHRVPSTLVLNLHLRCKVTELHWLSGLYRTPHHLRIRESVLRIVWVRTLFHEVLVLRLVVVHVAEALRVDLGDFVRSGSHSGTTHWWSWLFYWANMEVSLKLTFNILILR